MKKLAVIILALALAMTVLAGCGESKDKNVKIAIIKIVEHPSLDTIETSTIAQLEALGYKNGENAVISAFSAQGDPSNVAAIMDSLVADGTNLVIAITTPVAMVALNYAEQIPLIFSAVSNPIEAKLTSSLEHPDKNVTGTCDAVPVESIIDFVLQTVPGAKKAGFIYNPGEASSVANIDSAKAYCDSKGISYVEASISSSTEIAQSAQALAQCDFVFTPTDNTVAEGMAALAQVCIDAKVPCFVGADSMVKDGGLATIGIKYEDLGIETANMAKQVLDGVKISDIPVKVFTDLSTYINLSTAEKIGVTFDESVLSNSKTVIFE
ncbi:MAG: ABC transporter substrate-binding protein [Oscillospiraceae bacterium]|jgi:putative ABC transport system substrate-binding protein|nr:ABC transporter substrate-binding protein [Oscillospiraceae bacterium]